MKNLGAILLTGAVIMAMIAIGLIVIERLPR